GVGEQIPLLFGVVEVVGEFVGESPVLGDRAEEIGERIGQGVQGGEHEVGPAGGAQNAAGAAGVKVGDEVVVEDVGGQDLLTQHVRGVGGQVGALAQHRVDGGVGVTQQQRGRAVGQFDVAVAHRRRHTALQDVERAIGQIELVLVDPSRRNRIVGAQCVPHQVQKRARIVVVAGVREDLQVAAGTVLEEQRGRV